MSISDAEIARLTRLRLRLHRLAGRKSEQCFGRVDGRELKGADGGSQQERGQGGAGTEEREEGGEEALTAMELGLGGDAWAVGADARDAELGISVAMAQRLPAGMLEELRHMPRKQMSLEQSRDEFERRQLEER